MAYAKPEDVIARIPRDIGPEEEQLICVLLEDAAILIDACAKDAGEKVKAVVSCRMVIRALGDGNGAGVPIGATQGTMTAGPYSQTWTLGSGSSGELYLSKADKAMLGVANRIGASSPLEGTGTL